MTTAAIRTLIICSFCTLLSGWVSAAEEEKKPPSIKESDVKSIEITLGSEEDEKPGPKLKSTDAKKISALLGVLAKGKSTKDHKCADSGEIKFTLKGGKEPKFGILAGHHADFYEYRYYTGEYKYHIFKVDRKPFLKAMADLGATKLDLGMPESS